MIDHDRMDELLAGKAEPETTYEEVFLVSYLEGFQGLDLLDNIEKLLHELHKEDFNIPVYMLFGYGMGQRDLRDSQEEALDLRKSNKLN